MNISTVEQPEVKISRLLALIGQPARVQILLVIARQEACVCHIEAVLALRQAAISQHLMMLREAGLVTARRDGRNIFYQLQDEHTLDLIHQAAALAGIPADQLPDLSRRPVDGCPCPQCNPDMDPELTCGTIRRRRAAS